MIERALISTFDKTGLEEFVSGLTELGVEVVASGGTADHLAEHGIEVTRVEELTEIPELLGGRVKTLHPRIHAAILARRDHPDDLAALDEHDIRPFDLVCVNLYPFTQVVSRYGVKEEDAVEMIDIGGPSMLRAAAKNFAHVAPVCLPERYGSILAELRESGQVALETRRALASEAFSVTAAYEAAIARWFADRDAFPDLLIPGFVKETDLVYGENPHQRAAYYSEAGVRRHLLSRVGQLHGRELSFNNLADLSAARMLMLELTVPACVIVKHGNPCGVAVAGTIEEAYDNALTADPMSAYGGVVVVNRPVGPELGGKIAEQFVEVLLAPDYDEQGLEALRQKPNTRILVDHERRRFDPGERDFRRVLGGMLVQDRDWGIEDREGMEVVTGRAVRGGLGRPALRLARLQARDLERDRDRQGPADDRDRRGSDEPGGRGQDRGREGGRARPRPRGSRPRVRCVLPVPGRPAGRPRRRREVDHPAGRLEARPGRGRRSREGGRRDGLHPPAPFPPLKRRTIAP